MNTSTVSYGIDTNYKIIIPSKDKKKEYVSVETNTDAWVCTCRNCVESEKQISYAVGDRFNMTEYAKAINYINSIHTMINEAVNCKNRECENSTTSLNCSFNMPDVPNFLTIFTNLNGIDPKEKRQMATKSTSTTTLLPLCEALKKYSDKESIKIQFKTGTHQNLEKQSTLRVNCGDSRNDPPPTSYSKLKNNNQNMNNKTTTNLSSKDSACSCVSSVRTASSRKGRITETVSKASPKVDTHWKGETKKFNSIFGKKPTKGSENGDSPKGLSEAEIDRYATQLLSQALGDCKNIVRNVQNLSSSKIDISTGEPNLNRTHSEKTKIFQKTKDDMTPKVREKPATAIPVKQRSNDMKKCKLKACTSEIGSLQTSSHIFSNDRPMSQETKHIGKSNSQAQDDRPRAKIGGNSLGFQLPSLTNIEKSQGSIKNQFKNNEKKVVPFPSHVTVALPHVKENVNSNYFRDKELCIQTYLESRLGEQSSGSVIMDDQEYENCTDSDICDDVMSGKIAHYVIEEFEVPKEINLPKDDGAEEKPKEPFRHIRTLSNASEMTKLKNCISSKCKKCLKYSDSTSNVSRSTYSSDIKSDSDVDSKGSQRRNSVNNVFSNFV